MLKKKSGTLIIRVTWPHGMERLTVDPANVRRTGGHIKTVEFWRDRPGPVSLVGKVVQRQIDAENGFMLAVGYAQALNPHILDGEINWGLEIYTVNPSRNAVEVIWVRESSKGPIRRRLPATVVAKEEESALDYEFFARIKRDQNVLRRGLLGADKCCAITGCTVAGALDAAHIVEKRGSGIDDPDNGILLRADIHRLFDLRLFTIEHKGKNS